MSGAARRPAAAQLTCFASSVAVAVVLTALLLLYSVDGSSLERTLAMIKPDCMSANHTESIKATILESGFTIIQEAEIHLDAKEAAIFYAEHYQKVFFDSLVNFMTSGPVLVLVLEKHDAIRQLRALIGPTDSEKARVSDPSSIRALYGTTVTRNCIHASDSSDSASREISFFKRNSPGFSVDAEHDEL